MHTWCISILVWEHWEWVSESLWGRGGVQSPDWEPQKYEPGWLAIRYVAWLWGGDILLTKRSNIYEHSLIHCMVLYHSDICQEKKPLYWKTFTMFLRSTGVLKVLVWFAKETLQFTTCIINSWHVHSKHTIIGMLLGTELAGRPPISLSRRH
jgi:hypothetical protein